MVEVNIDDKLVIMMEEGPKVTVNKNVQPLDESHPLMMLTDHNGNTIGRVVHTPDHTIRMRLPNHKLDIVYAQSSLIIRVSSGVPLLFCFILLRVTTNNRFSKTDLILHIFSFTVVFRNILVSIIRFIRYASYFHRNKPSSILKQQWRK